MREKVSAKPTDEGCSPIHPRDPSSDPLRGPPSPARGEGSAPAQPAAPAA
ncbi:MAG TPA: hypothetical protein VMU37_09990 [Caulobacteraceae bacterium]|nr:hypothetical protein [Caulobacteraceae bacterium]